MGSKWATYITGGNAKWYIGKQLSNFLFKNTPKYDPAIYSCMQMFTEALFITAKTWKQYKYPTTNE